MTPGGTQQKNIFQMILLNLLPVYNIAAHWTFVANTVHVLLYNYHIIRSSRSDPIYKLIIKLVIIASYKV